MARAAVPGRLAGRLAWRVARLAARRDETPTARTLVLDVEGWPGHLAGQHVDVRLTAEDGYSTQRSYSLAGPADGDRIELTIQRVPDGEVSPYLTDVMAIGDPLEVRGPVGGWFVWHPVTTAPVLLIAGGSGIVPLMAMIRARRAAGNHAPFRLFYSVRTPGDVYYAGELGAAHRRTRAGLASQTAAAPWQPRAAGDSDLEVTFAYTRAVPNGWPRPPGRVTAADIQAFGWPPDLQPRCYVCGPTGFVETAADILVGLGHDARLVKTERFGPTGN
ncbi:MAG: ferredoxin reductase [Micromonosporaceae bacterium]